MHTRVGIIGTGWLGLPLARDLADDFTVVGSYRSSARRDELLAVGATAYCMDLPNTVDSLPQFFAGLDTLIVALPPGGRRHGSRTTEHYLESLDPLRAYLPGVHLIYTSSTGVYGKSASGTVTEETPVHPDTPSSEAVVAAEAFFQRHSNRCTILRLAGLYGPGRDPVRFFQAVEEVPKGDAPVNLVHLDAVIQAIRIVLKTGETGIFNVCSARHESKRKFYGRRFEAAGLPAKTFLPGGHYGKRIDSSKLRQFNWKSP